MTGKQRAFVAAYISCLNATEAARLAGYKGDDNSLASIGWENLRKLEISEAINARLRQLIVSADETLARVSQHATGTMADFLSIDPDGVPRLDFLKAQKAGRLGLIKKYTETENTRATKDGELLTTRKVHVELYPADAAHDKLMRYHSLYNDKLTVTWQNEILALLRDGRVTQEDVIDELGYDLAEELFKSVGILATTDRKAQTAEV